MNNVIITVGGSGQLILHYYVQLFLVGVIDSGFRALVIDTDQTIASLDYLSQTFIPNCGKALGQIAGSELPVIDTYKLEPSNQKDKVHESLGYFHPSGNRRYEHPAQAYYGAESLNQTVSEGLFGRPCLSAVIGLSQTLRALDTLKVEPNTRIVLVTSCIGGTGAGLSIPILQRLQGIASKVRDVSIRLVLLGRYFQSAQDVLSQADQRFDSNKTMYLRTLKESVPDLHSYAFIEEPRARHRDYLKEAAALRLPWPEADSPYWHGICALSYLIRESVRERRAVFEEAEVPSRDFVGKVDRGEAEAKMKRALARVRAIIRKQLVPRIDAEGAVDNIWGTPFTSFLREYWHAVQAASHNEKKVVKQLARGINDSLSAIWDGTSEGYGLRFLFPEIDESGIARLADIRNIRWPQIGGRLVSMDFANTDDAHRRIASAILHGALRFGARI